MDWWYYESGTKVDMEALNKLKTRKDDKNDRDEDKAERDKAEESMKEFYAMLKSFNLGKDINETLAFMLWIGGESDKNIKASLISEIARMQSLK